MQSCENDGWCVNKRQYLFCSAQVDTPRINILSLLSTFLILSILHLSHKIQHFAFDLEEAMFLFCIFLNFLNFNLIFYFFI